MGLDMYIEAERSYSGYDFGGDDEKARYRELLDVTRLSDLDTPDAPWAEVSVHAAYWRKANAIHQWFVTNVQSGVDECQRTDVTREQLGELRDLCKRLLDARANSNGQANVLAAEHLPPPQTGFFFGSTEIDERYWNQVESTVTQLDKVLSADEGVYFYYRASW